MSIVKINAITVPRERFEEFAERFASRAGKVEEAAGFEAFELLRPNDDWSQSLLGTRLRAGGQSPPGARGGEGAIRARDPRPHKPELYQLSYCPRVGPQSSEPRSDVA